MREQAPVWAVIVFIAFIVLLTVVVFVMTSHVSPGEEEEGDEDN